MFRSAKSAALFATGTLTFLAGAYGIMLKKADEQQKQGPRAEPKEPKTREETRSIYNRMAKAYDQEIGMEERLIGIGKQRKALAELATGVTLEVGCGTGRNLAYYPATLSHITLTDFSPNMIA